MRPQLRVNTTAVQAMATRWDTSAGELYAAVRPAVLGLSCQPSAAAVNAGYADIAAFTTTLAARVAARATHVSKADADYITNETNSADELAAVAKPVIGV